MLSTIKFSSFFRIALICILVLTSVSEASFEDGVQFAQDEALPENQKIRVAIIGAGSVGAMLADELLLTTLLIALIALLLSPVS